MSDCVYPLVIDTLAKHRADRAKLYVHCFAHGCPNSRSREIDLDALIERLGPDHSCLHDDLVAHFYCSHCRAAGKDDRNIGFIRGTPDRSKGYN